MARRRQEGNLFFRLDVDFFSDRKVKILKARYGADGITLYLYLLCEIYKTEVSHRIYVRFRNDITADMRIKYHGRIFTIEGPPLDIDERHELLEIQCREVFEGNEYQV